MEIGQDLPKNTEDCFQETHLIKLIKLMGCRNTESNQEIQKLLDSGAIRELDLLLYIERFYDLNQAFYHILLADSQQSYFTLRLPVKTSITIAGLVKKKLCNRKPLKVVPLMMYLGENFCEHMNGMRVVIAHAQFKNGMQDWLSLEVFDQLKNATFYHLIRLFVIIPIQLLLMKNSWNVPRLSQCPRSRSYGLEVAYSNN
ncbi:hypothetical protein RhiirA5_467477 [Rhizophagus irregularis]|uniref:Uncharacterized protein n=1 Tax=Rhizophagus irregularis TaxID=588596 RepID=A0A2I1E941_9GLOM|nr:hypothetical protein RhiirA5_467477 [Rhizophagus irregularis]PKC75741.1 hypothetical protein RhiirA1_436053 [Rhizophagus irregularis]PKY18603.1 hypothetical protein RhiirB3_491777 [Rhizophagus irregularis]